MVTTKNCSKCLEVKITTEFFKDKHHPTGFSAYCKPCKTAMVTRRYYESNGKEKLRLRRANNPEVFKQYDKRKYEKHASTIKESRRKHYQANREKKLLYSKAYQKANLTSIVAYMRMRHTKKLQRCPRWTNLDAIKEFYRNCPPGYHVDHIIPLQGKLVSGLHVLENLQYLPAATNMSKSNSVNWDEVTPFPSCPLNREINRVGVA